MTAVPRPDPGPLAAMLAEHEIRGVVLRYCRGIDRRRFDLVRDCYHPDAVDEHGDFTGTIDEFITHCERSLATYETTTHFVGNIVVDLTDDEHARCETYVTALHRVPARGERPPRDHVVGLRYVDDFEKRDGCWRIATRLCVFDWTRTDPVQGWQFTQAFRRGHHGDADAVFAPSLTALLHHPPAGDEV